MTELRKRMDEAMVLRGLALRTRETDLACVRALAKHYRRSPDTLTNVELQADGSPIPLASSLVDYAEIAA